MKPKIIIISQFMILVQSKAINFYQENPKCEKKTVEKEMKYKEKTTLEKKEQKEIKIWKEEKTNLHTVPDPSVTPSKPH